jgi:hypothetical protein
MAPGGGIRYWDLSTNQWKGYVSGDLTPPDPEPIFEYEKTKPENLTPLTPGNDANVGWNGFQNGTISVDTTVADGQLVENKIINAYLTLGGPNSLVRNCMIYGGPQNGGKPAFIKTAAGGRVERCTFWGTEPNVGYWTNGITVTAGTLYSDRNYFSRFNDHIKCSGDNANIIETGSFFDEYAFFDDDADHPSEPRALWTHNDGIQASRGTTLQHIISGSRFESYFDCTGVTWSGGSWGVGTASVTGPNSVGMPATALNQGYWRLPYPEEVARGIPGRGTWANGITFSNRSGYKVLISGIWIDGVNASSGLIQFTPNPTGPFNELTLRRSRFGCGGFRSGAGKIFLVSYQGSYMTATIGAGADANVYDNLSSVPIELRGQPLTFGVNGASVIL